MCALSNPPLSLLTLPPTCISALLISAILRLRSPTRLASPRPLTNVVCVRLLSLPSSVSLVPLRYLTLCVDVRLT